MTCFNPLQARGAGWQLCECYKGQGREGEGGSCPQLGKKGAAAPQRSSWCVHQPCPTGRVQRRQCPCVGLQPQMRTHHPRWRAGVHAQVAVWDVWYDTHCGEQRLHRQLVHGPLSPPLALAEERSHEFYRDPTLACACVQTGIATREFHKEARTFPPLGAPTVDEQGRLRCGAAVGTREADKERVARLVGACVCVCVCARARAC